MNYEQQVDKLAADIRRDALSGFKWNVPEKFEDAAHDAKELWRYRARQRLTAAGILPPVVHARP